MANELVLEIPRALDARVWNARDVAQAGVRYFKTKRTGGSKAEEELVARMVKD